MMNAATPANRTPVESSAPLAPRLYNGSMARRRPTIHAVAASPQFSVAARGTPCTRPLFALVAISLLAMHALSMQARSASAASSPPLTPVEAGQDINPLAVGLRPQRVDLRGPSGFDRLYRVAPGTVIGGVVIREGGFARISGSTVVVFPRGQYSRVAQGVARADVPPGTMYLQANNISELIGSPQERADGSLDAPTSSVTARRPAIGPSTTMPRAMNAMISPIAGEATPPQPVSIASSGTTVVSSAVTAMPSLWTDEAYRQRRMGALIDAASASLEKSSLEKSNLQKSSQQK